MLTFLVICSILMLVGALTMVSSIAANSEKGVLVGALFMGTCFFAGSLGIMVMG
ncbi:MAG: hypothetical protein ABW022_11245 [Actinoplanes sp.]